MILDDRDDSVLGAGWSDEDEELEDDFCTPRHLPTLDEQDGDDSDFNLSQSRRIPGKWQCDQKWRFFSKNFHKFWLLTRQFAKVLGYFSSNC